MKIGLMRFTKALQLAIDRTWTTDSRDTSLVTSSSSFK